MTLARERRAAEIALDDAQTALLAACRDLSREDPLWFDALK